MILAAIGDGPYDFVNLLHIISVILGTGTAFLAPVVAVQARKSGGDTRAFDAAASTIMAPALFAAGIFGGALVGMSDDVFDFGQAWLSIGGLVWLIAVGAAAVAYPPSYVKLPDMSDKRQAITGVLHLSLALMLILMIWKPGL